MACATAYMSPMLHSNLRVEPQRPTLLLEDWVLRLARLLAGATVFDTFEHIVLSWASTGYLREPHASPGTVTSGVADRLPHDSRSQNMATNTSNALALSTAADTSRTPRRALMDLIELRIDAGCDVHLGTLTTCPLGGPHN